MRKLLTIAVLLALGGCTAPQEQVLKKIPDAVPAQARNLTNCSTSYVGNGVNKTSFTTCN